MINNQTIQNQTPSLLVMEIERFAIHDGEGIRSVVFLQGCPLRCPWCSNPESQQLTPQLLYSRKKCIKCGACATVCQEGAITFTPEEGPVFTHSRCTTCGNCAGVCPVGAIRYSSKRMTIEEILQVVLRDESYYQNSGGGLTISGGEPFTQYEGFLALIQTAKEKGLQVAIETTGQVPLARLQEAEPFIDTFLLDFKHPDEKMLKEVIKANTGLVFQTLEWLSQNARAKVILRVPVVPGFNHNEQAMRQLFDKADALGYKQIHLLPYHTLGTNKYSELGIQYPWPHSKMLTEIELLPWQQMGQQLGLHVQIGG